MPFPHLMLALAVLFAALVIAGLALNLYAGKLVSIVLRLARSA